MFHFVSTVSVASRNLRASTPLLIDGHAVGNADINRRVVIRACAPCLAWKTIFHTGDNSCRPGRPLLPSFLILIEVSLPRSLARSRLLSPLFLILYQTSFFLTYGFPRRRRSHRKQKLRQVCLIDAGTNTYRLRTATRTRRVRAGIRRTSKSKRRRFPLTLLNSPLYRHCS